MGVLRGALVALVLTSLSGAAHAGTAPADAQAGAPADFVAEARVLWRVVGCGGVGSEAIPAHLPAATVDRHCKALLERYAEFDQDWAQVAAPFLAALRPAGLPARVVYPFGGGDLLFALVTFPDATEITSISLERAGNVRVIAKMSKADFKEGLADAAFMIHRLAGVEYSFTEHMEEKQASKLPVQVTMALAALAARGYEPIGLSYFAFEPDGRLRYLSVAELDAGARKADKAHAAKAKAATRGVFAGIPRVYGNVEIRFRKLGDARAPVKIYRSVAANLHDSQLAKEPGLMPYLVAQGDVAAMVKAASYLLWRDDFSKIRAWLLASATWMVSDSTGPLPMHASAAGLVQTAYGKFRGSLLGTDGKKNRDMIALWKQQPERELGFRFGYPDWAKEGGHLLITTRKAVAK